MNISSYCLCTKSWLDTQYLGYNNCLSFESIHQFLQENEFCANDSLSQKFIPLHKTQRKSFKYGTLWLNYRNKPYKREIQRNFKHLLEVLYKNGYIYIGYIEIPYYIWSGKKAAIPSLCDSSTAATLTHKGARAGWLGRGRAGLGLPPSGAISFIAESSAQHQPQQEW